MPNSANKSNNNNRNSGKGQPKDRVSDTSSKPNPERSDRKQGRSNDQDRGITDRSSNQGRKQASGGSANE